MTKYFRDETGMYIDWNQLSKLPDIDTLIDIGVGPMGTPDLHERFSSARLLLIDPLDETQSYIDKNLGSRDVLFHKCAVGKESDELIINVEKEIGRSSILQVAAINYEGEPLDKRKIKIKTLDSVTSSEENLGKIGIKIDKPKYFLITGTPLIIKGEKTGSLITINDLTLVKKLEKVRQDFVSNVSHELKTPITSIAGFVGVLKSGTASREEEKVFIDKVLNQTNRMNNIIDDLLKLSLKVASLARKE